jgi:hypothetical protein
LIFSVVEFREKEKLQVAALNMKDPEVHELAVELARRTRQSITAAVKSSLRESIARHPTRQEDSQ